MLSLNHRLPQVRSIKKSIPNVELPTSKFLIRSWKNVYRHSLFVSFFYFFTVKLLHAEIERGCRGRVQVCSLSSLEVLEMERTPSELLKDDSLFIYGIFFFFAIDMQRICDVNRVCFGFCFMLLYDFVHNFYFVRVDMNISSFDLKIKNRAKSMEQLTFFFIFGYLITSTIEVQTV